jgi:hypothetical protein
VTFTHSDIALTALITGLASAGVGIWRLTGRARLLGGIVTGVISGLAVYLWRASANMPQLNADGLPGLSANDWLAPILVFVTLSVFAGLVVVRPSDRYGQVRAAATVLAFAVNVITI